MEVSATREEFDKWKRKCFVHSELHDISATIYIIASILLFYFQILLTGVTSSLIFIADVNHCNTTLNIISGVFSVLGGLLTIVIKNFDINEKGAIHRQISQNYIKLINSIDLHLVDPDYTETTNVTFLQGISEEYTELSKNDYVICSLYFLEKRHKCTLNELLFPNIASNISTNNHDSFTMMTLQPTMTQPPRMHTNLSQQIKFIVDDEDEA